jgi:hypothetical protein
MDKALDEIIRENNTGLRRFQRGGHKRGGNFGGRSNQNFRDRPRGFGRRRFNNNDNNDNRMALDKPLSARRPQPNLRGGNNRRPLRNRFNNRSNGQRDFGFNNGIMKVCNYQIDYY